MRVSVPRDIEAVPPQATQRPVFAAHRVTAHRAAQRGNHVVRQHRTIFNDVTPHTPTASAVPTQDEIVRAPKALLHDHLDGGLRPATIVDLAAQIGHTLPADDPESLGAWFAESADSGSLE